VKKILIFLYVVFCAAFAGAEAPVWEISKDGNTLYLGGSIHLLREDDYPLPREFDTAFGKSDILVLEADVSEAARPGAAQNLMQRMLLPGGETLQTILDENTYNALKAKCEEFSLPIAGMAKFKPALVVNILTVLRIQQFGFIQQGVDLYYFTKARDNAKEILFLETAEFQLDLLAGMGSGYENEFVLYSLKDLDTMEEAMLTLITGWRNGDAAVIESILAEMREKFPTVYKEMIGDRNQAWMPFIESYFTTEAVEFVIVGSAHIYGSDGLLKGLEDRGYLIKRIEYP
jgi:uncharacterized protein YbaP (TraB family)